MRSAAAHVHAVDVRKETEFVALVGIYADKSIFERRELDVVVEHLQEFPVIHRYAFSVKTEFYVRKRYCQAEKPLVHQVFIYLLYFLQLEHRKLRPEFNRCSGFPRCFAYFTRRLLQPVYGFYDAAVFSVVGLSDEFNRENRRAFTTETVRAYRSLVCAVLKITT